MCRKLLLLIAVLGLIGTAFADDLNPPPWRGLPGTTLSAFTYDSPSPITWQDYPRVDPPDYGWYIPHPEKGDPDNYVERAYEEGWLWDGPHWSEYGWVDPYPFPESLYETHAMQLWGSYTWMPTFQGRTGVLAPFGAGSWDIFNFWSEQPAKDVWIQLTWMPWNRGAEVEFNAEMEYFVLEPLHWIPLEWNYYYEQWWQLAGWSYGEWFEDGWQEYEEAYWSGDTWVGGDEPVEYMLEWWDEPLVPFETIALEGDWRISKFLIELGPNPVKEFFGLFPNDLIAVDQIVIDTICYVPEPATIALLGLGGLALIRRRKR